MAQIQRSRAREPRARPGEPRWGPDSAEARLLATSVRSLPVTLLHGSNAANRGELLLLGVMPLLARRNGDHAAPDMPRVLPFPERRRGDDSSIARHAESVLSIDDWPDQGALQPLAERLQRMEDALGHVAPGSLRFMLVLQGFEAALLAASQAQTPDPFWRELVQASQGGACGVNLLLATADATSAPMRWLARDLNGLGRQALRLGPRPTPEPQLEPVPELLAQRWAAGQPSPAADWRSTSSVLPSSQGPDAAPSTALARSAEPTPSAASAVDADWLHSLQLMVDRVAANAREDETAAAAKSTVGAGPAASGPTCPVELPASAAPLAIAASASPPLPAPAATGLAAEIDLRLEDQDERDRAVIQGRAAPLAPRSTLADDAAADPNAARPPASSQRALSAASNRLVSGFGLACCAVVAIAWALLQAESRDQASTSDAIAGAPAVSGLTLPRRAVEREPAAAASRNPAPVANEAPAPITETAVVEPKLAAPRTIEPARAFREALLPLPVQDLRLSQAQVATQLATNARPQLALVRHDALQGLSTGTEPEGLRLVLPLFVEPVQVWVRADSPARRLHQLRGAVVDAGRDGGDELTASGVLQALFGKRGRSLQQNLSDADALGALLRGEVGAVLRVRHSPLTEAASAAVNAGSLRRLTLDRNNADSLRALHFYMPLPTTDTGPAAEEKVPGVASMLIVHGGDDADRARLAAEALQLLCPSLPRVRAEAAAGGAGVDLGSSLPSGWPFASGDRRETSSCAQTPVAPSPGGPATPLGATARS